MGNVIVINIFFIILSTEKNQDMPAINLEDSQTAESSEKHEDL